MEFLWALLNTGATPRVTLCSCASNSIAFAKRSFASAFQALQLDLHLGHSLRHLPQVSCCRWLSVGALIASPDYASRSTGKTGCDILLKSEVLMLKRASASSTTQVLQKSGCRLPIGALPQRVAPRLMPNVYCCPSPATLPAGRLVSVCAT